MFGNVRTSISDFFRCINLPHSPEFVKIYTTRIQLSFVRRRGVPARLVAIAWHLHYTRLAEEPFPEANHHTRKAAWNPKR
jgi:hypothetical protein